MKRKLNMTTAIICPSLLSCDFARLGEESKRMLDLGADWLHCDVMDGHFVPNLTIGAPIIQALRKHVGPDVFLDCHLMIENPEKWINDFHKAGANQLTLHIETTRENTKEILAAVRAQGMKVGVAIKPETPIDPVLPYLNDLDMVLVMTVEPGFGGQKFMSHVMPKVKALREKAPGLNIQVDGGLDEHTIKVAAEAGANVIVAGSSIFGAKDPGAVINNLRAAVNQVIQNK